MRVPRRTAAALTLLAALAAIIPGVALAATVQQIVDLAQIKYSMSCSGSATEINCLHPRLPWTANIKPGSGEVDSLDTGSGPVTGFPMDPTTSAWMTDMHQTACGSATEISDFVKAVAAITDLSKTKVLGPVDIGTCSIYGGLYGGALAPYTYHVVSLRLPPPTAGPTGTPVPTAAPTASAKPTPTPAATSTPTHTAAPAATATPTTSATPPASASPGASASAGASESPSATTSAAATAAPTASPVVAGAETGPPASEPPTGGGPAPTPTLPTFESSVLGIEDVNGDGGAIGGSLLLALLMLLIIGFAGELFNNTVENNYDEISGWFRKGPLGWLRRLGGRLGGDARVGLLAFLVLTAFISSFVDPHFGPDLRSLGEFLGFLVGLIVVLASFKLPMILARRRKTGELGRLRPLPWALAIAALFVLVSRVGNLQPGYLYGIVLGAIFLQEVPKKEEGRETFYGSLWTLAAAALGWLGLTWVRSLGYDPNGFGVTLLSTAFAAILVAGLEATAFGLMPLRFMPGHAVYTWNRLGWGLLFGLSLFAFVHLLISPTSGYVSQLSPQAFIAACGIFAAFGALSIVTWGYFRFRPKAA